MATDPALRALLPEGLRDDLPPWAEHEAMLVDRLMATAAAHGYERVAPPLVEFEESMAAFAAPSQMKAMFRVLDPVSQKMMAVRADMTAQVARIATSRLAHAPRPLRLSYAGHVLRVRGSQLRPSRQFRQAGVELIGPDSPAADLEVVTLAAGALTALGIPGLSLDLVAPRFVPALAASLGLDEGVSAHVAEALDCKDAGALAALPDHVRAPFSTLLHAAGEARRAASLLAALELSGEAAAIRHRLLLLAEDVARLCPGLPLTIDPGESRGFSFQTGIGFAFFARDHATELCRGGRYVVRHADGSAESAVGFSMYLDGVLKAAPPPLPARRLYLPFGTPAALAERLRSEGWRTVAALAVDVDAAMAARALGCTHVLASKTGMPQALTAGDEEKI